MRLPSCTLLLWIVPCLLLSGCPRDSPSGSTESDPSASDDAVAEAAACGIDTAEKMAGAEPIFTDIDGDSRIEQVTIFKNRTNQEFPLLARWDPRPGGRRRDAVWAVATQIVVRLRPGTNPDEVWDRFDGQNVEFLPSSEQTFLVRLSPQKVLDLDAVTSLLGTLSELREDGRVAWAEPDYLFFTDVLPNDGKFTITNFRKAFDKVQSLAAWDAETGFEGIRVAVIDTGIDSAHPDLKPNLLTGFNVIDKTTNTNDDNGHGSYCAGLIGAQGNDGTGMTGVNWDVSLVPVKAFDTTGCGTSERAANAIRFAADHCTDVISASWGGLGDSTNLKQAIEHAGDNGTLFVASAGNSPSDLDIKDYFPATYNLANMIVVGSSNVIPGDPTQDDTQLASSGHGTTKVHLSAPGNDLSSAWLTKLRPRDPYIDKTGTSPAVALVAGAAALVKAKNRSITLGDLRCRLLKSTDAVTSLSVASCSGGRLNVEKAVKGTGLRSVCGCP
jgi:subtilisin family serine protease